MSDNNPTVSIVIPCLNEAGNIGKCIDSIKAQHCNIQYEIIAVDNGSKDDTVRIIKNEKVIFEQVNKSGPAAAKNRGIERAKGDIIFFIDADCVAHPDWLKSMIMPFGDADVGCVAGEIGSFEPKTEIEKFLIQKKHLSQSENINHCFLPYAATANSAYRREVFKKIGPFDESLVTGEDADMSWRMQLKTPFKLTYCPGAVVFHPQETAPRRLFKQKERHAYGSAMLYKKYKQYWKLEHKTLKQLYWEYRSITRRSLLLGISKLKKHFGLKFSHLLPFEEYQVILELGWKLGMIRGSIRHRVWFV